MKIAVVGTGYVGLVTATCFAQNGNFVSCVDIDVDKVAQMKSGKMPIYEPHLEDMFQGNIAEGRLTFTTKLAEGIKGCSVIFLALPTPPGEDGSADISYILKAVNDIGPLLKSYVVVVNKSTVPVGTTAKVHDLLTKKTKSPFDVVSNPEFLREGFAVEDFMKPDRVIIGTSSEKAKKVMDELYAPFLRQGNPIYFMDERSSEMTKYAANAFLATKISFMNEIANLCEAAGADVDQIRLGIGADDRIGKRFLFPGIGYGGSCFPKDVQALQKTSEELGYNFKIIEAVSKVNQSQKMLLVKKIKNHYNGKLEGLKFGMWGLAFKPNTDDIREAPALQIIKELISAGASVVAHDPQANNNVRAFFGEQPNLAYEEKQYDAISGADALIIATEWPVFRSPDFGKLLKNLKTPTIFDGRNLYKLEEMRGLGFYYESIGRKVVNG